MLEIALLGRFDVRLNGERLPIKSRPLQKIAAYLAMHAGQSIPRTKLAGTLWLDSPEATARKNLRHHLWRLRQIIGDEYVLASRNAVTFNHEAAYRLDVERLEKRFLADDLDELMSAVSAYRGEFLPGFYDDWVQRERERLQALFERRMQTLVDHLAAAGRWHELITWAEHWIAHAETPEPAYRALMTGSAGLGDLGGVAAAYGRCKSDLSEAIGVPPSLETEALYETLMSARGLGDVHSAQGEGAHFAISTAHQPAFLREETRAEPPLFVGRAVELARLDAFLAGALEGRGQVVFVAGDAGSGKSSLIDAFTNRSGERVPSLLVGLGICNAISGRGDPYLPFRRVFSAFTGDLETEWALGTITGEHARTMWQAMPVAVEAVLDYGPDLLDAIIPTAPLLARLKLSLPSGHPLLGRLREHLSQGLTTALPRRAQLFEQVAGVLRRLAQDQPVVILLDDLHWADRGSLDLLFHLARNLAGSRILLLGTYRPDAVTAQRDHPLRPILHELRRYYGDIWLDLNQVTDRSFVDALIDSEPNHLNEAFRQSLYNRTAGHPLFTVELLRNMQEQGDLLQDGSGAWVAGPVLNWDALPVRVEGAIEARIDRLAEEQKETLQIGAVEGQTFTLQVVAGVQGVAQRDLLLTLTDELQDRHHLVAEQGLVDLEARQLDRFGFAHGLFQNYFYRQLSAARRRFLHKEIATVLEDLYTDHLDEVAVQLAHHYIEAGLRAKALPYLLKAGDRARTLYAFEDALGHYNNALAILKERRDYEGAGQVLMKIGLSYHGALDFERSSEAYQQGFLFLRQARDRRLVTDQLFPQTTIRTHSGGVPDLDPIMCHNLMSFRVCYQLFGTLVTLNRELDVVPDMAESWHIQDDGQMYAFKLRDDLVWSDGQPVTAHDFAFRLRSEVDPAYGTPVEYRWNEIVGVARFRRGEGSLDQLGIDAPDARTLHLRLEQPSGTFLQELIHLAPVPAHVVEKFGPSWTEPEHIVSCGPFLLSSWNKEASLVLQRNPDYYGTHTGNVTQVQFQFIDSAAAVLEAYAADELDIVDIPSEVHEAMHRFMADYVSWPDFRVIKVNLNTRRPPFDNGRIRRALALATDRHLIAETAARGLVTPATGGYIPLGMPGHRPDLALPYDLQQAQRLLAEEGFPNGQGLPTLTAAANEGYHYLIETLNHLWRDGLGLNIRWQLLPWADYDRLLSSGEVDLYVEGLFAATPNLDSFMGEFAIPRQYWPSEAFSSLVEKAQRTTDPAERLRRYQLAEDILLDELPIIPLFYWRDHRLIKPWIKHYRPTLSYLDPWKDVLVVPHAQDDAASRSVIVRHVQS